MQILRRSKSVFKIKFSLLCACYKQPYTKEQSNVLQILPWVQVLSLSFASFSLMDICLGFWQASLRRLSKVIRGGVVGGGISCSAPLLVPNIVLIFLLCLLPPVFLLTPSSCVLERKGNFCPKNSGERLSSTPPTLAPEC